MRARLDARVTGGRPHVPSMRQRALAVGCAIGVWRRLPPLRRVRASPHRVSDQADV